MTPELLSFVDRGQAAERSGDAAAALEYHRGIPLFAGSPHRALLTELAGLADEMTPWLWARWAAYQCTRAEDDDTQSRNIARAALDYAVRMFHARELHDLYVTGGDPVSLTSRVLGEDWAYRQICVHELGGLGTFLDELADGRLRENDDLARQWVDARMGGFRVEDGARLSVWDPARDELIPLVDLGAGASLWEGAWMIGRLVPSGSSPGHMFATRPLPVDEATARAVASGTGRGEWVTPLVQALDEGRVPRATVMAPQHRLVTDVTWRALIEAGTPARDLERTLDQFRRGRDEAGRAAFRILRSAAEGSFGGDERAPYVAAAVLHPHAYAEARRHLPTADSREAFLRWSALVPEPARGRLVALAESSSGRAA